jgi:hypothetical protein
VLDSDDRTRSIHRYWRKCRTKFDMSQKRWIDGIMIYFWWNIWKERNRRAFQQTSLQAKSNSASLQRWHYTTRQDMKSSFFFGVASVTLSPSFVSFSLLSLVLEWTRRPVCRSSFSGGMSSIEVASILVVASLLFSFYPSNKNRQSSCHLSRKIMLYVYWYHIIRGWRHLEKAAAEVSPTSTTRRRAQVVEIAGRHAWLQLRQVISVPLQAWSLFSLCCYESCTQPLCPWKVSSPFRASANFIRVLHAIPSGFDANGG